jgi:multidrug efflux pump subunit AcrA (membrane-fusion protein)
MKQPKRPRRSREALRQQRTVLCLSLMLVLCSTLAGSNAISAPTASSSASPSGVDGVRLVSPRRGTFVQQVQLVGNVEARNQLYLSPGFSTKLEMLAEDGAQVKKGDVVARLDVKTIEEELDEQVLSVDVAKSAAVEQERTAAADRVRLDAEIQRAQATVDQKALALRQLEQGTRPEELRKQLLNRNLAQRALDLSRSTLALKEKLAAKGISTQLEVLQGKLDLTNKERDYRVAEATYRQGLAGATPLARQLARVDLDKARQQLAWSRQNLALTREQAALDHQKLVAQQGNVTGRVKLLQKQTQQAVLRAPITGTVVLSKTWTSEGLKRATVGDDVQEGNPFLSVADLSQVVIKSELEETLLREVKVGTPCVIVLPSQRGQRFTGKVSRIGVLAHELSNRENTQGLSKVFDLDIFPDSKNSAFKPGTSVDIQLPLVQRPNVLLLPRTALSRNGDRHYVLLADGTERTVILGDVNAQDVVITQGLTQTDQVRLPQSAVTSSESESEEAESGSPSPEAAAPAGERRGRRGGAPPGAGNGPPGAAAPGNAAAPGGAPAGNRGGAPAGARDGAPTGDAPAGQGGQGRGRRGAAAQNGGGQP